MSVRFESGVDRNWVGSTIGINALGYEPSDWGFESLPTYKILLIMEEKLFEWLKFRFIRDNHKRYHKYFDEWISNITQSQIEGFKKCMFYDTEKVLMRG